MTKTKQVRFYFHKVVYKGNPLDLSKVFDEVAQNYKKNSERYTFEISDDKYKLERIVQPNDMEPYYHLVVEELFSFIKYCNDNTYIRFLFF